MYIKGPSKVASCCFFDLQIHYKSGGPVIKRKIQGKVL